MRKTRSIEALPKLIRFSKFSCESIAWFHEQRPKKLLLAVYFDGGGGGIGRKNIAYEFLEEN